MGIQCARKEKKVSAPVSFVDRIPKSSLSVKSKIPVVFRISKQDTIPPGKEFKNDYVTIKPATKHKLYWKSDNVLIIYPEEKWEPGQEYWVTLHLNRIFPNEPEIGKTKEFKFKVKVQRIRVSRLKGEFLPVDGENPENMYFKGTARFTDLVDDRVL